MLILLLGGFVQSNAGTFGSFPTNGRWNAAAAFRRRVHRDGRKQTASAVFTLPLAGSVGIVTIVSVGAARVAFTAVGESEKRLGRRGDPRVSIASRPSAAFDLSSQFAGRSGIDCRQASNALDVSLLHGN